MSYLLWVRCAPFEGGPFKGASLALSVHVVDWELKSNWLIKGSLQSGARSGFSRTVSIRSRCKPYISTAEPRHDNNLSINTWKNIKVSPSLKVLVHLSPPCSSLLTDKTEIPARDINHSMTLLTHRPFSSAGHPIIRLNAASSYEASESNG